MFTIDKRKTMYTFWIKHLKFNYIYLKIIISLLFQNYFLTNVNKCLILKLLHLNNYVCNCLGFLFTMDQ